MDFTNLRNCIDSLSKKGGDTGVDCIVCKDNKQIYRYSCGYSDVENKKEICGNEQYLIYSMTKIITCTAALQLLEKNKYLLNDPVSRYLPEFSEMKIAGDAKTDSGEKIMTGADNAEEDSAKGTDYAENPILIKHLFSMSAGLDYQLNDEVMKAAYAEGKSTTREIVGAIAGKTLHFEPGTRFQYSLCHDVIGALIEVWSGKKLGDYMKENIFDVLGMKNTFFDVPKDAETFSRMAKKYNRLADGSIESSPLVCRFNMTPGYQSGGAGLCSCTEDYALFTSALACGGVGNGGRILSPATIELMKTNQIKDNGFYGVIPGYGYGLGVRVHINKADSGVLSPLGEFGWDGAAGGFALVDTENRLSLTLFRHLHNWDIRARGEICNALYSCFE